MKMDYDTQMPLRGNTAPVFNDYRSTKETNRRRRIRIDIPGWATGVEPNNPIPYQKNDLFDFTYSVHGPPDLPVNADRIGKKKSVYIGVQPFPTARQWEEFDNRNYRINSNREFYNGPQEMQEHFVTMPFTLATELPCSVSGFKY